MSPFCCTPDVAWHTARSWREDGQHAPKCSGTSRTHCSELPGHKTGLIDPQSDSVGGHLALRRAQDGGASQGELEVGAAADPDQE